MRSMGDRGNLACSGTLVSPDECLRPQQLETWPELLQRPAEMVRSRDRQMSVLWPPASHSCCGHSFRENSVFLIEASTRMVGAKISPPSMETARLAVLSAFFKSQSQSALRRDLR